MGCEYNKIFWDQAKTKFKYLKDDEFTDVLEMGTDLCKVCPKEFKSQCEIFRLNIKETVSIEEWRKEVKLEPIVFLEDFEKEKDEEDKQGINIS